jgi:predicted acylesterase/phospholipase RssA
MCIHYNRTAIFDKIESSNLCLHSQICPGNIVPGYQEEFMAKFRILSLDGGGIRGLFTLVLLERLTQVQPDFLERVDFFAGTSTGSIIALGLAHGLTPAEGVTLYRDMSSVAFKDSLLDDLLDLFTLIGAEYDNEKLRQLLLAKFQQTTLGDLRDQGKYVLVPTFDLDSVKDGIRSWKPKFFHNFPGSDSDSQEQVVDVALRSSAAPTYFPSYQGYVDGGLVTNNPSMAALAQALHEGVPQNDVHLFSVGTGFIPQFAAGEKLNWGYLQWAPRLLPIILDGLMGVADYQCRTILQDERYFRLAPVLGEKIDVDDVAKVDRLVALAQAVDISAAADWLARNW